MGVRDEYSKHGVDEYYLKHGNEYENPHFETVKTLLQRESISGLVLDLACGNGEATMCLDSSEVSVVGCDPYLYDQYIANVDNICYNYSFDDVIDGKLENHDFDVVICSFAMHLCDSSKLNALLYQLARISRELIILTPNKKPEINDNYWLQWKEVLLDRVRMRRYSSKLL